MQAHSWRSQVKPRGLAVLIVSHPILETSCIDLEGALVFCRGSIPRTSVDIKICRDLNLLIILGWVEITL